MHLSAYICLSAYLSIFFERFSFCVFVFFFNDTATTEIYTLSLHDALPISLVAAAPPFLYCSFLVAAAPRFLYCPFLVAAAPTLFILTYSCCGSTPASYTAHFSLRQRPSFLYLPILVAAAPLHFILTNARCGSALLFIMPISRCGSVPLFILPGEIGRAHV